MARITRKELKSDKFALEVEHTVNFFEDHRQEIVRYGGIALVAVVLIIGYIIYSGHQHAQREEALARAIQVQEAPVGPPTPGVNLNFPTQDAKDQVALKAFADVQSRYPGTTEGFIAEYYLGAIKADQGKLGEAETLFKDVAGKADAKYASLAQYSLAQIYFADGRADLGESTLRDLMAHPTIYVSKDQAALTLARFLSPKKPAEARKLLDPLRSVKGTVGQNALAILSELPPQ
ncbi:MAG TPA: tetratricopeptide repeat protein [Bryobacteraceae bacterium]|nr:tetratricopeptide repeat protein [Bryobacteraceae bacterium]